MSSSASSSSVWQCSDCPGKSKYSSSVCDYCGAPPGSMFQKTIHKTRSLMNMNAHTPAARVSPARPSQPSFQSQSNQHSSWNRSTSEPAARSAIQFPGYHNVSSLQPAAPPPRPQIRLYSDVPWPQLRRGLTLLSARRIVDAMKFFTSDATAAAASCLEWRYLRARCESEWCPKLPLTGLEPLNFALVYAPLAHYCLAFVQFNSGEAAQALSSITQFHKWMKSGSRNESDDLDAWAKELAELKRLCEEAVQSAQKRARSSSSAEPADPVREKWENMKRLGARSAAIDDMMKMTGLASVKEQALQVYSMIQMAQEKGDQLWKKETYFNSQFVGNPGTGKTTVGKHYAKFLHEVGAIGREYVEVTGAKLASERLDGLKTILANIEKAGGGVLFVDETYQLLQDQINGKPILEYLLGELPPKRGQLIVVFAGYQKDMEGIQKSNPGLASRIPIQFVFDNFTDDELLFIAQGVWKRKSEGQKKPYTIAGGLDGPFLKAAIRRISAGRDSPSFGNARDVDNFVNRVITRQSSRIQEARMSAGAGSGRKPELDLFHISKEDLLGHPPSRDLLYGSPHWKKLSSFIGLGSVKREIEAMFDIMLENYELELQNKKPRPFSLNRCFVGNPGTGKTEVAKLYGALLKDLGILSKGTVMARSVSDFLGSAIGQSEEKTRAIIESSAGCVLLIDEAYGLHPSDGTALKGSSNPYKEEVLRVLVEQIQNTIGEDRCVVMMGYEKPMQALMDYDGQPGLKRRFGWEQRIDFVDYTGDELAQIIKLKMQSEDIQSEPEAILAAVEILERQRNQPSFGNAGAAVELIKKAISQRAQRLRRQPKSSQLLIASDFNPRLGPSASAPMTLHSLFQSLVGREDIRQKLEVYQNNAEFQRKRGDADPYASIPRAYLFTGPPGTGKTTMARKMGSFFKMIGLLSSDEVLEKSASDFIPGYVGQSGPKTQEILRSSIGKVLFIDEAYRLARSQFGTEVLDELVNAMTSEEFGGKVVIILAGYEDDIDALLARNSGLRSRFNERIKFTSLSLEESWQIIEGDLKRNGFTLNRTELQAGPVQAMLEALRNSQDWGNARDLLTIAQKIRVAAMSEFVKSGQSVVPDALPVPAAIVESVVRNAAESRQVSFAADQPSSAPIKGNIINLDLLTGSTPNFSSVPAQRSGFDRKDNIDIEPMIFATASFELNPPPVMTTRTVTDTKKIEEKKEEARCAEKHHDGRDPGVSDAEWMELEEAKKKHAQMQARQEELEREIARIRADDQRKREEAERLRKLEEEKERLRQMMEQRARMLQKLQSMGVCPMGYSWFQVQGGWRCGGGSHFMSDMNLM